MASISAQNNGFQIFSQESPNYELVNINAINSQHSFPNQAYSFGIPIEPEGEQNMINLKRKMRTQGKCYLYFVYLIALLLILTTIRFF